MKRYLEKVRRKIDRSNTGQSLSLLRWPVCRRLGKRDTGRILIACMPKSGSTFFSSVISNLPGYHRAHLVPAYGHREQELSEVLLSRHCCQPYVAQHHVRYSQWTEHLLKKYSITPVVLTRNLFDVVPSLVDHTQKESRVGPTFYMGQAQACLDREQQLRFMSQLAIPWYVNFYMGWRPSLINGLACHVTYKQLVSAPLGTVKKVLAHAGVRCSDAAIEHALEVTTRGGGFRLNVGKSGRGRELPESSQEYIRQMLAFYAESHDDAYVSSMLRNCPES